MGSCAEMGEAIELRLVEPRVNFRGGEILLVHACVCVPAAPRRESGSAVAVATAVFPQPSRELNLFEVVFMSGGAISS